MYDELFSIDNILKGWLKFKSGKTRKTDVVSFEYQLEDNLFSLYEDLKADRYLHSPYSYFQVFDNKKRDIYKAKVRDRIIHQIIFDYLVALFEPVFISDSYASRVYKGTHKAIRAVRYFVKLHMASREPCFVLTCDIRKYFDSIDQNILFGIIKEKVVCGKTLNIIREIIYSYHSSLGRGKGVPLGNITSQVFANIYLNLLDQYLKGELRQRFFVRYNDDFLILSDKRKILEGLIPKVLWFANDRLLLNIPSHKITIRKISWGVEFLGGVVLPNALLLRDSTQQKVFSNLNDKNIYSYLGILRHCETYNLRSKLLKMFHDRYGDPQLDVE